MHARTIWPFTCRRILVASLTAMAVEAFAPMANAAGAPPAPTRAAGLWELKHIGGGGTAIGTQTLCISAASEAKVNLFGQIALNVNCRKYAKTVANGLWSFEFVCGPAAMTSTSKGTVTGDFATAYKIEMTESDGTMDMERTIQATRKGACPAGVAPGALMDDDGKLITNIVD